MTISYLMDTYGENFPQVKALKKVGKNKIKGVMSMIEQNINSPPTSSCGRLFDAVSFLAGLSPLEVEFEAEAPMRLESQAAEDVEESYDFSILKRNIPFQISFVETIRSIIKDLAKSTPPSVISAKFHNTLARIIARVAKKARKDHGIDTVVLIGGVFLNKRLLHTATQLLEGMGFKVLRPINYAPNDESISVGQIAYALNKIKSGSVE